MVRASGAAAGIETEVEMPPAHGVATPPSAPTAVGSSARTSSTKATPRFPDLEFFVVVSQATLKTLKLPDKVARASALHQTGSARVKEFSSGQETWQVTVHGDGTGSLYFMGNWEKFARFYKLEWGFFLTFRHRLGSDAFLVKVFDGEAWHRSYLDEAEESA
jgi:hypothetical protein